MLGVKEAEHVLIKKVEQLFRNRLSRSQNLAGLLRTGGSFPVGTRRRRARALYPANVRPIVAVAHYTGPRAANEIDRDPCIAASAICDARNALIAKPDASPQSGDGHRAELGRLVPTVAFVAIVFIT
jgi:hypothetical protein